MKKLMYSHVNTDYGRPMKPISLKSRAFGIGQTNWADKFWGIYGIFGQTISTHFGKVSPLSMFFHYSTIISTSQIIIWVWDLNLNLGSKKLGI